MSADCTESYRECMAARRARVEKVLSEAQPGDTQEELAEPEPAVQREIVRLNLTNIGNHSLR
jgi:hypothetical protein